MNQLTNNEIKRLIYVLSNIYKEHPNDFDKNILNKLVKLSKNLNQTAKNLLKQMIPAGYTLEERNIILNIIKVKFNGTIKTASMSTDDIYINGSCVYKKVIK
jgi:hypothetical protein